MVPVPAGPFMMGTSQAQVDEMLRRFDWAKEAQEKGWFAEEQPEHEVTLPAFEIGRYPVTNAQYTEFARAERQDRPDSGAGARSQGIGRLSGGQRDMVRCHGARCG